MRLVAQDDLHRDVLSGTMIFRTNGLCDSTIIYRLAQRPLRRRLAENGGFRRLFRQRHVHLGWNAESQSANASLRTIRIVSSEIPWSAPRCRLIRDFRRPRWRSLRLDIGGVGGSISAPQGHFRSMLPDSRASTVLRVLTLATNST